MKLITKTKNYKKYEIARDDYIKTSTTVEFTKTDNMVHVLVHNQNGENLADNWYGIDFIKALSTMVENFTLVKCQGCQKPVQTEHPCNDVYCDSCYNKLTA